MSTIELHFEVVERTVTALQVPDSEFSPIILGAEVVYVEVLLAEFELVPAYVVSFDEARLTVKVASLSALDREDSGQVRESAS